MEAAPVTERPRIVVTVQAPSVAADPSLARRKNALYAAALRHRGGHPVVLDETSSEATRAAAFAAMDGLLLTGGADVDPARYGEQVDGSVDVEHGRDALEATAFAAARGARRPVLGICRGFQVMNVLSGGRLVQHLDGHGSPSYGTGPANHHAIALVPGSRLATILQAGEPGGTLLVNTYHHQAVRPADLAPGLRASAFAESPIGPLVEGLEGSPDEPFFLAVQCHPERTESTPAEFDRLWDAFVAACRRPATVTPGAGRPR